MAGKRKRRQHLIQTLTLTKRCSPEVHSLFFLFFLPSDHTQAGDVHVRKAAVILMKLGGARVPRCCQHRYISSIVLSPFLIIVLQK